VTLYLVVGWYRFIANLQLTAKTTEKGTNTELIIKTKEAETNTERPKTPYTSSDDSSEESGEEVLSCTERSRKPPVHELLNLLHRYESKFLSLFTTFTRVLLSEIIFNIFRKNIVWKLINFNDGHYQQNSFQKLYVKN